MEPDDTVLAIPTYRLRDVAETIEAYDTNFWRNGHAVKLMVFDDSSVANHEKTLSPAGIYPDGQRIVLRWAKRKGGVLRVA